MPKCNVLTLRRVPSYKTIFIELSKSTSDPLLQQAKHVIDIAALTN